MSDNEGRYYKIEEDLRFPPMTAEEELDLARRMKKDDESARELFITRHLLYALKLGRRFGSRLPVDETTSAANEALMFAIGRFDPELGFRFRSFLVPYVRAAIARCWRSRSPVDFKHGEPPIEVPMENFEEKSGHGEGSRSAGLRVPAELIAQPTIEQEDHDGFLKGELAACAESLSPRDREIVRLHYVEGFNLAEIGKILKPKLSRERVRQIHEVILVSLRESLERRGIRKSQ